MKFCGKISLFFLAVVFASLFLTQEANAQRRSSGRPSMSGDMSLGLGVSTVSASQTDINGLIDTAVTSGASVKNLSNAWEFYANWGYRVSGTSYAFIFRPSYFMQSTTGSGSAGSYKYDLTGYTLFPIFRIYPLENYFIKFYMQTGLGYGSLNGSIAAGNNTLDFKGSAFGAMGGIGVDFCFTDSHCLTIEGNMRYMPIERNLTSGGNCSSSGSIPGVSQCGGSSEVERGNNDLGTTFSGVQGLVGYTMNF